MPVPIVRDSSIIRMARVKATITIDRDKATAASLLVHAKSTSEVVDKALDHLIRVERLRQDIAAYRRHPVTDEELILATLADNSELTDDTDWDALYSDVT